MAASSSSHSASEARPSPPDSTWAHEPWFLEHNDQAETEPQPRGLMSASLNGLREGVNEYCYDDGSSDSSDTDSLASAESASSARRHFEAVMSNARQLAVDLVEVTERWAAFELERGTGDFVGTRESPGEDEDEETLPRYERVGTLPPSYEAAVVAVEAAMQEEQEQEQEAQLQQVAWMQGLRERERRRRQQQGLAEQEWERQWAGSEDPPEPWLETYETQYEGQEVVSPSLRACRS